MPDNINPYASPTEAAIPASEANEYGPISAWEQLRFLYNGLLVAIIALCTVPFWGHLSPGFGVQVLMGMIGANFCFCAGPVIETYLSWLGINAKNLRLPLFIVGTLLSACITVVSTLASGWF